MIATTIEQSMRLLELGLDPATADMKYTHWADGKITLTPRQPVVGSDVTLSILSNEVSAWSLSALLEVMPGITTDKVEGGLNHFNSAYKRQGRYGDPTFYYIDFDNKQILHSEFANYTIDAACEMVVWLLGKGYIKKKGEQQ